MFERIKDWFHDYSEFLIALVIVIVVITIMLTAISYGTKAQIENRNNFWNNRDNWHSVQLICNSEKISALQLGQEWTFESPDSRKLIKPSAICSVIEQ